MVIVKLINNYTNSSLDGRTIMNDVQGNMTQRAKEYKNKENPINTSKIYKVKE